MLTRAAIVFIALVAASGVIARAERTEYVPERLTFAQFPRQIGEWINLRDDAPFDDTILAILGIAQRVRAAQRRRQPTLSVDTKKKELVGPFKNAGRTWRPAKTPQRVRVHDFVVPATATTGGKAIPYGIYDLHRNEGWVSVG